MRRRNVSNSNVFYNGKQPRQNTKTKKTKRAHETAGAGGGGGGGTFQTAMSPTAENNRDKTPRKKNKACLDRLPGSPAWIACPTFAIFGGGEFAVL